MNVVILAGGLGSRFSEETAVRPKPMVEIGGRPILWHIMHLYAHHGLNEFVAALGYKAEMVREYFLRYHQVGRDVRVRLADGSATTHGAVSEDWTMHLIDSGLSAQMGGRIKRLRQWIGNETFCLTYGDGVRNVDITRLASDDQLRAFRHEGFWWPMDTLRDVMKFIESQWETGKAPWKTC